MPHFSQHFYLLRLYEIPTHRSSDRKLTHLAVAVDACSFSPTTTLARLAVWACIPWFDIDPIYEAIKIRYY